MIAETELGSSSNGISSEVDDMNIESMSMNENESDAIVRRASNVNAGRCVKRTDHESVAGRVSVFTGTTVTRSKEGVVVKSGGSDMSKGWIDLSKTIRSNVGEDMTLAKLKTGNDVLSVGVDECAGDNMVYGHHGRNKVDDSVGDNMVYVHHGMGNVVSESKCGNFKGDEVSIWRPSSDGSTGMSVREMPLVQMIGRAHFKSGSDGSKVISVREMYQVQMSAEYCDDSSRVVNGIDRAIEVDGLELSTGGADKSYKCKVADESNKGKVSTGGADESNKCKFLDVEKIDQREQIVNTCECEGESECRFSYVERFGQRKQSLEASTCDGKSSLKVERFGRAGDSEDSLEVDELGRAGNGEDSLRAEKFGRAGKDENGLEVDEFGRAGNGDDRLDVGRVGDDGIEMTCDSVDEDDSISLAEVSILKSCAVKEERGSDVYVEQGRELSIARQFPSVSERYEVECDSDNSLDSAEECSVNYSVMNVDQGGEHYVTRQSQSKEGDGSCVKRQSLSEKGGECSVARRSRSDVDDEVGLNETVEDLNADHGNNSRLEVERSTRDETSDDQREVYNHRDEMHESGEKVVTSSDKRAVVEGTLDGSSVYDDLNVKQGGVLSDTRHSQTQDGAGAEVAENSDMELSVACEVCSRCYGERESLCECDMSEGRMMKHDNVKLGRVIDVDQHSQAHDCMGDARVSKASERVGTGDIGRRDDCAAGIAHEQVGMRRSRCNAVLEYDCSLVVLYNGTERCNGKRSSLEKTEVKFDAAESETLEHGKVRRLHSVDGLKYEGRVEAGRQCRSSEANRYNDGESIGMWILLLIARWKVYSEEQVKYLWRVRGLNLNMQDKARVTNSGESSTSACADVGSKIDVTGNEDGLGTVRFKHPVLKQKLKDGYDVSDVNDPNAPAREGQVLVRGDGSGQLIEAETTESRKLMRSRPKCWDAVRGLAMQMAAQRGACKSALHSRIRYVTSKPNRGGTLSPNIVWSGDKDFEFESSSRSDSDYATTTDDRRSVTGGRTFLNSCPMLELGRVLERVIQPKHSQALWRELSVSGKRHVL